MRILFHSNSPWANTGYGVQTALFTTRFKALGHDVAISAMWGLGGATMTWSGMTVYPQDEKFGNHMLVPYAAAHGLGDVAATQVITLLDVWVFDAVQMRKCRMACWTPVDHDPLPPRVQQFFERSGAQPIAMSEFGRDKMAERGLDPLYVPHGVDTTVYAPHDDQQALREMLGMPRDAFVVGMVANNQGSAPPRKAFPQAFAAFKRLLEKHDDAILYLHTEKFGIRDGVNLVYLLEHIGIPESAVRWVPQFDYEVGIEPQIVAGIYSAMDVLLSPSYGEGFGIPVIEAQACGRPVIVSDFTAQPELCGAGWTVTGDRWYDASQGADFMVPSIDDIYEALEAAYDQAREPWIREQARTFACRYDADLVTEQYWVPVLAELEDRFVRSLEMPAATLEKVA